MITSLVESNSEDIPTEENIVESEDKEPFSLIETEFNDNCDEINAINESNKEKEIDSNIILSNCSKTGSKYLYSELMIGKSKKFKCQFNPILCTFITSYLKDMERHFRFESLDQIFVK